MSSLGQGEWSDWREWISCSGTDLKHQIRYRSCSEEFMGGSFRHNCEGRHSETRECEESGNSIPKPGKDQRTVFY